MGVVRVQVRDEDDVRMRSLPGRNRTPHSTEMAQASGQGSGRTGQWSRRPATCWCCTPTMSVCPSRRGPPAPAMWNRSGSGSGATRTAPAGGSQTDPDSRCREDIQPLENGTRSSPVPSRRGLVPVRPPSSGRGTASGVRLDGGRMRGPAGVIADQGIRRCMINLSLAGRAMTRMR